MTSDNGTRPARTVLICTPDDHRYAITTAADLADVLAGARIRGFALAEYVDRFEEHDADGELVATTVRPMKALIPFERIVAIIEQNGEITVEYPDGSGPEEEVIS